jgi:hypothetical protein
MRAEDGKQIKVMIPYSETSVNLLRENRLIIRPNVKFSNDFLFSLLKMPRAWKIGLQTVKTMV